MYGIKVARFHDFESVTLWTSYSKFPTYNTSKRYQAIAVKLPIEVMSKN